MNQMRQGNVTQPEAEARNVFYITAISQYLCSAKSICSKALPAYIKHNAEFYCFRLSHCPVYMTVLFLLIKKLGCAGTQEVLV